MKITYDELLAKIDDFIVFRGALKNDFVYALRAVVELHEPTPLDERGDVCLTCCPDLLTLYPCPTIQAIEKKLK